MAAIIGADGSTRHVFGAPEKKNYNVVFPRDKRLLASWGPIDDPPAFPPIITALSYKGFKGVPQLGPMMPRDASLADSGCNFFPSGRILFIDYPNTANKIPSQNQKLVTEILVNIHISADNLPRRAQPSFVLLPVNICTFNRITTACPNESYYEENFPL